MTPLEAIRFLLVHAARDLDKRDLDKVMPHTFYVALATAQSGEVTEETIRVIHEKNAELGSELVEMATQGEDP